MHVRPTDMLQDSGSSQCEALFQALVSDMFGARLCCFAMASDAIGLGHRSVGPNGRPRAVDGDGSAACHVFCQGPGYPGARWHRFGLDASCAGGTVNLKAELEHSVLHMLPVKILWCPTMLLTSLSGTDRPKLAKPKETTQKQHLWIQNSKTTHKALNANPRQPNY